MAFTLNDIEFKPSPRYFKGGIQGTMVIGQYTDQCHQWRVVVPAGFGGSYGSIVEDFKASGTTYDSSSFEVAVWITKGGKWVTDELFEHLTGGGGVIGYRTAAEVDDILHTLFQMEWGNGRVEPEVLA